MPFYFNGTLIPENVANALTFNGTNITDVYFNGVQIWHQQLCKICTGWSASVTAVRDSYTKAYFEVSGLSWRYKAFDHAYENKTFFGEWQTVNGLTGSLGGNSYTTGTGVRFGIQISGTTFRLVEFSSGTTIYSYGDWGSFNPDTKVFSFPYNQSSISEPGYSVDIGMGLWFSGGSMRVSAGWSPAYSGWTTLT